MTNKQLTLAQILAEYSTVNEYRKQLQSLDYDPNFKKEDVIQFGKQIVINYFDRNVRNYADDFNKRYDCFNLIRTTFIEKALRAIPDKTRRESLRNFVNIEIDYEEQDLEILANLYKTDYGKESLTKDLIEVEKKLYLDYQKSGRDKLTEIRNNLTEEHYEKKSLIDMMLDIVNNGIGAYFTHLTNLKEEYTS